MVRQTLLILVALAVGASAQEQLPVRRVVLYKNGVGYFEHVGRVRDKQDVAIPFTSGQLDDVLKSLTVLDLNGGHITGVAYGSSAPVERQLGDLHLPVSDKASVSEFLGGLRGARIEVREGTATITGRVLSVERKTHVSGSISVDVDYLSLITDAGELRTTEITPAFSVRLLDKGLTGKVERLLDIAASGRDAGVRSMVISTEGTGERSLFVSYISEVPVWKSTYRIVLSDKAGQAPLLQGWAIVDNTVGEDWDHVELSLVAGAPQSFVENLSQPYYVRRPVVGLPQNTMVTPQTFEATLAPGNAMLAGRVLDATGAGIANASVKAFDMTGALAAETQADANGNYQFEVLPEGAVRVEAAAQGFQSTLVTGVAVSAGANRQQDLRLDVGSSTESVDVAAGSPQMIAVDSGAVSGRSASRNVGRGNALGSGRQVPPAAPAPPPPIGSGSGGGVGGGMFTIEPVAAAQELGDLFEYKLKDPITIPKNRSALVPIAQTEVQVEKVSVWNDRAGLPRPQRALWLTNTSGLTLDGGSFSVMEDETFAGEGIFEPIRPGEKRLMSYALDLALNASSKSENQPQRITRCSVSHGVLKQTSEIRESRSYTFRNEDSTARTVIVEHPVRAGYALRSEAKPVETTAAWMRFRLPVASKQTATLTVDEARPTETTYLLTNLTDQEVDLFVRQRSIDPTIEKALRVVLAQKAAIADLEAKKDSNDEAATSIYDDQQRLRENMKALKGSPEEKALLQRYTQQLNEQEDRLARLSKENEDLAAQVSATQEKLNKTIDELSFDVQV